MIRVAITGPESSGKTTLAEALAKIYGVGYVPEFSRAYLEKLNRRYVKDDLDIIAKGHFEAISKSQDSIQFIDTEFVVLKIWSEYRFGKCTPLIEKLVVEERFDLYILCSPDIPWEDDPLRENPHDREVLFNAYWLELNKMGVDLLVLEGPHEERVKKTREELLRKFNIKP